MKIQVNNVILDCWEESSPNWFHIKQHDCEVSFRYDEAQAIASALQNLVNHIKDLKIRSK